MLHGHETLAGTALEPFPTRCHHPVLKKANDKKQQPQMNADNKASPKLFSANSVITYWCGSPCR